jgi:hypothetical protein
MMEYAKNSCVLNFWEWEVGRGKFYDEISTSIMSMLNKLCQILKIEDEFLNLIYYEQTIRF